MPGSRSLRRLLALRQRSGGIFDELGVRSEIENVTNDIAVKIVLFHDVAADAGKQNDAIMTVEVGNIARAKGVVVGIQADCYSLVVAIADIVLEFVAVTAIIHIYSATGIRAEIIVRHFIVVAENEPYSLFKVCIK